MKKLDSKLFKNNTISKNKMGKTVGGTVVLTRTDSGHRDIYMDGVMAMTVENIEDYL